MATSSAHRAEVSVVGWRPVSSEAGDHFGLRVGQAPPPLQRILGVGPHPPAELARRPVSGDASSERAGAASYSPRWYLAMQRLEEGGRMCSEAEKKERDVDVNK